MEIRVASTAKETTVKVYDNSSKRKIVVTSAYI